jgi:hypothetical protein
LWLFAFHLLPKGLFALFVLAAFVILLAAMRDATLPTFWLVAASMVVLVGLTFAPQLLLNPLWLVARSALPIASIPAILLFCALCFTPTPSSRVRFVIGVVAGAWLVVTIASGNRILAGRIHTDLEDREIARLFYSQIVAHEQQTGQQIRKIGIAVDRNPNWCYPDVHCYGDVNTRCWKAIYCGVSLMRVISGRNFGFADFETRDIQSRFGKDDWNEFSPDEIRFAGDTAYIAAY